MLLQIVPCLPCKEPLQDRLCTSPKLVLGFGGCNIVQGPGQQVFLGNADCQLSIGRRRKLVRKAYQLAGLLERTGHRFGWPKALLLLQGYTVLDALAWHVVLILAVSYTLVQPRRPLYLERTPSWPEVVGLLCDWLPSGYMLFQILCQRTN